MFTLLRMRIVDGGIRTRIDPRINAHDVTDSIVARFHTHMLNALRSKHRHESPQLPYLT